MKKLRRKRVEAHAVAKRLLDSKGQELKGDVSRKDIMSLLGPLLPSFSASRTNVSQREDRILSLKRSCPKSGERYLYTSRDPHVHNR